MTASVLQAEKSLRKPSVVLDNPANARPITGMTGAPHPITLHGPDVSPRTLMPAPTKPARPLVVDLHPPPETTSPRCRQSMKYAETSTEAPIIRTRSPRPPRTAARRSDTVRITREARSWSPPSRVERYRSRVRRSIAPVARGNVRGDPAVVSSTNDGCGRGVDC